MNLLNLYFLAGWLPTMVSSSYTLRASQLVGTSLQVGGVIGTFAFSWVIGRLGFIPVLTTAFFTACAAIDMVGVMLNPPRADFASPVRAYETMTASLLMGFPSLKNMDWHKHGPTGGWALGVA